MRAYMWINQGSTNAQRALAEVSNARRECRETNDRRRRPDGHDIRAPRTAHCLKVVDRFRNGGEGDRE